MDAAFKAATGNDPTTASKDSCCYKVEALTNFIDVNPANQATNEQKYQTEGLPVKTTDGTKYMCDNNINKLEFMEKRTSFTNPNAYPRYTKTSGNNFTKTAAQGYELRYTCT